MLSQRLERGSPLLCFSHVCLAVVVCSSLSVIGRLCSVIVTLPENRLYNLGKLSTDKVDITRLC